MSDTKMIGVGFSLPVDLDAAVKARAQLDDVPASQIARAGIRRELARREAEERNRATEPDPDEGAVA